MKRLRGWRSSCSEEARIKKTPSASLYEEKKRLMVATHAWWDGGPRSAERDPFHLYSAWMNHLYTSLYQAKIPARSYLLVLDQFKSS